MSRAFPWLALLAGLAGVAAVVFVFTRLFTVNASTAGFFFLIVVLGVAATGGFRVSALVSIAAMLSYNFYFLPPIGRFTIADPENWTALFAFLVTALVASHLSDRAQTQAAEARRRQQETEQLYALSRSILLTEGTFGIGDQAAQSIAQIFGASAVLIQEAKSNAGFRGGPGNLEGIDSRMQDVIRQSSRQRDASKNLDIWPISLGGQPIGALAAVGLRASDGAIQSMLNLVAIALERVRTVEAANRAEVARRGEELKSTLLDAIAHELKTPLTSIKAAATGLRTSVAQLPPEQYELTAIIEEETDRLGKLVTEAMKTAEIDAGKVKPKKVAVEVDRLLSEAAASYDGRGGDRIRHLPAKVASINADPEMVILALRQLLDNALKYSSPGTPITCDAAASDGRAILRVRDQGPGIPEAERERIFERYYRRRGARGSQPGFGLGLNIARNIAQAHGGDLWVESDDDGSVFCLAIPLAQGETA